MDFDLESEKKRYESRVDEILTRFLKNIKECDQDPDRKKPWKENENDDVCDIVRPC